MPSDLWAFWSLYGHTLQKSIFSFPISKVKEILPTSKLTRSIELRFLLTVHQPNIDTYHLISGPHCYSFSLTTHYCISFSVSRIFLHAYVAGSVALYAPLPLSPPPTQAWQRPKVKLDEAPGEEDSRVHTASLRRRLLLMEN